MGTKINILFGVLASIFLSIVVASEAKRIPPCKFPEIFTFGDSNSDTAPDVTFRGSTGNIKRIFSDGRVILDFITEKMRRPYLPCAYVDKNTTNFKCGASFAVGGSTIKEYSDRKSPSNFLNETAHFSIFKALTVNLQSKGKGLSRLPRPKDFSKALYIIDMGQNDVTAKIMYSFSFQKDIEEVILVFEKGVKNLYNEGARVFWIHNTGPHGCLPFSVGTWFSQDLDEIGCKKYHNKVASEFNQKLKEKIIELRTELKEAVITYVDIYSAKYKLFSNAKNLGFMDPLGVCKVWNSTCADPSKYILWDTVHYTEAANRLVAQSILDGALSDPPLPITHACYRYVAA